MEISPLPLPAQGLVGCPCTRAGPGCCLTSAHPCPVEKSLHIQSPETCPGSQVVLHASTHTPRESLGTGEPSLRHPQMPASVFLINRVHSPVPHHNPAEQGLHPPSPPLTSSHLQSPLAPGWDVVTHICACSVAAPSALPCLCVCVHRQGVPTLSVQPGEHACLPVCLSVSVCRHTAMPAPAPVSGQARGWQAEAVPWCSFPG